MMSTGIPLGLSWATAAVGNWSGLRLPDPFPTFNFAVEIEGLLVAGFNEVSGLDSQIEMQAYREGGVNGFAHQLPGAATPANLVLRQGLGALSSLWNWYDNTTRGVIQRRSGTIVLLDRRQIPVMWWNFRNALPVRWSGPTFNAGGDEVGFESVELAHEGLTKPLLGQAAALGHGVAGMAG
ncbi:phage tail protein [Plantactinospora sp. WMMB334]|uniref:phage tail protein n=1 Tax=Plantactinospora sp. WMMB334 TaxID=3404119 RepID=UPI003B939FFB